jgi:hypothetical protein
METAGNTVSEIVPTQPDVNGCSPVNDVDVESALTALEDRGAYNAGGLLDDHSLVGVEK